MSDHDDNCECHDCDGGCPRVPDVAPCVCTMVELLQRGCTCGAMAAERAKVEERPSE